MSETDLGTRDEPSPASGTLAALGVTDDRLHRLSVDLYHMIDPELVCEDARVELLEGLLVSKTQASPQRASAWRRTDRVLSRLVPDGWFVTTRDPVTLTDSEPEPDVMLVRGDSEDYCERHPGPAEVPLVIEVADVDFALVRGLKRRIYARVASRTTGSSTWRNAGSRSMPTRRVRGTHRTMSVGGSMALRRMCPW